MAARGEQGAAQMSGNERGATVLRIFILYLLRNWSVPAILRVLAEESDRAAEHRRIDGERGADRRRYKNLAHALRAAARAWVESEARQTASEHVERAQERIEARRIPVRRGNND